MGLSVLRSNLGWLISLGLGPSPVCDGIIKSLFAHEEATIFTQKLCSPSTVLGGGWQALVLSATRLHSPTFRLTSMWGHASHSRMQQAENVYNAAPTPQAYCSPEGLNWLQRKCLGVVPTSYTLLFYFWMTLVTNNSVKVVKCSLFDYLVVDCYEEHSQDKKGDELKGYSTKQTW